MTDVVFFEHPNSCSLCQLHSFVGSLKKKNINILCVCVYIYTSATDAKAKRCVHSCPFCSSRVCWTRPKKGPLPQQKQPVFLLGRSDSPLPKNKAVDICKKGWCLPDPSTKLEGIRKHLLCLSFAPTRCSLLGIEIQRDGSQFR